MKNLIQTDLLDIKQKMYTLSTLSYFHIDNAKSLTNDDFTDFALSVSLEVQEIKLKLNQICAKIDL